MRFMMYFAVLLLVCLAATSAFSSTVSASKKSRWHLPNHDVQFKSLSLKLPDTCVGSGFSTQCSSSMLLNVVAENDNQATSKPTNGVVSFFKKLVELYNDTINKYPMRTKVISSAVVGGLGDILIQTLTRRKAGLPLGLDLRRFLVFTTVAGVYIAPVINAWFTWLTKLPMGNSSNFTKAMIMMLVDQTAGAVLINAGFFFAFEMAQRLYPPYYTSNIVLALTDAWRAGWVSSTKNMWVTLVANWYCWPVINFANFLFIPLQYRLLFSNVAAVFWNMFLSSVANNDAKL